MTTIIPHHEQAEIERAQREAEDEKRRAAQAVLNQHWSGDRKEMQRKLTRIYR